MSFSLIWSQNQSSFVIERPLNPSLSSNGRSIAYETSASFDFLGNGILDVFVYDAEAKTNLTVSVNPAGDSRGSSDSKNAIVSPNGRWVLFSKRSHKPRERPLELSGG